MDSRILSSFYSEYSTITLLFSAIVVYILGSLIDYQVFTSYWSSKNIKGPRGLPFVGLAYKFIHQSFPTVYTDLISKYGKVFGTYEGRTKCLVITDADLIKDVLIRNFHKFSDRRIITGHWVSKNQLVNQGGIEWKTNRAILSPAFTSSKMKLMYPLMKQCYSLLDRELKFHANNGNKVTVKNLYAQFTTSVIAICAFATEVDVFREKKNPLITALVDWATPRPLRHFIGTMLPQSIKEMIQFTTVRYNTLNTVINACESIQKQRKCQNNSSNEFNDLLQLLLDAGDDTNDINGNAKVIVPDNESHYLLEDAIDNKNTLDSVEKSKKKLTQKEITANTILFFLAGYDTTSNLLTNATYILATHPHIQDKLYTEIKNNLPIDDINSVEYEQLTSIKYLDAFISEVLRLYPASSRLERVAGDNHTFCNEISIEKGTVVQIPIFNVHRDEDYFENALLFDPERFLPENRGKIKPGSYLPFVIGPKNCIGMRFALMEAKLALVNIVTNFKIHSCDETTQVKESFKQGFLLSFKDDVVVSISERNVSRLK